MKKTLKEELLELSKEYYKKSNVEAFCETQGFDKLSAYFVAAIEGDESQEEIRVLRERYNVPIMGFEIKNKLIGCPPKQWSFCKDCDEHKDLRKKLRLMCLKLALLPKDWADTLEYYFFYNKFFNITDFNVRNMCFLSDKLKVVDIFEEEDLTTEELNSYPIALHISPYASSNDIMDYICKVYETVIKPLQTKYRHPDCVIGKIRPGNERIKLRDKFIYDCRNLPNKEIVFLVGRNFPDYADAVDEGSIGKIISLQKKIRKKVVPLNS